MLSTAALASPAVSALSGFEALTAAGVACSPSAGRKLVELNIFGQGCVSFQYKPHQDGTAIQAQQFPIILLDESQHILATLLVQDTSLQLTIPANDDNHQAHVVCEVSLPNDLSNPTWPRHLIQFDASSQWIWISVDRENAVLKVGFGYQMQCNVLLSVPVDLRCSPAPASNPSRTLYRVKQLSIAQAPVVLLSPPKLVDFPVTIDPPPVAVSGDEMTLQMISDNSAIPAGSLPAEAQALWSAVAGHNIILGADDAAAINYSLDSPDGALHNMLKKKANEFGDDSRYSAMVYIRCTIGPDTGRAPGSSYVLELWPKGCFSPIHEHSEAVAVIKVLHGELDVHFFNPLPDVEESHSDDDPRTRPPIAIAPGLKPPSRTYILPELYQCHRLYNRSTTTVCATIQSYQYLLDDDVHYEFFDYVQPNNRKLQHFKPTSDYSYAELMKVVHQDWDRGGRKPYTAHTHNASATAPTAHLSTSVLRNAPTAASAPPSSSSSGRVAYGASTRKRVRRY